MTVQLAHCKHGRFLVLDNDYYIGRLLLRDGLYGEEEIELFKMLLRPGDIVVEAGSNIGSLTIPIARLVGEKGTVLAFEPQRPLYNMLCGNLALNEISNVEPHCIGVGATDDEMIIPFVDYNQM